MKVPATNHHFIISFRQLLLALKSQLTPPAKVLLVYYFERSKDYPHDLLQNFIISCSLTLFGSHFKCWIPTYSTNTNYQSCFPRLAIVSSFNNFAMSCGYCFSLIEFLEDFICLKTFQENNVSNSIIIRQFGELKLNIQ